MLDHLREQRQHCRCKVSAISVMTHGSSPASPEAVTPYLRAKAVILLLPALRAAELSAVCLTNNTVALQFRTRCSTVSQLQWDTHLQSVDLAAGYTQKYLQGRHAAMDLFFETHNVRCLP